MNESPDFVDLSKRYLTELSPVFCYMTLEIIELGGENKKAPSSARGRNNN